MAHPIPKATDSSLCNVWRNVVARDVEGRPDISTVGAVSSRYLPLSISRNTPQCTRAGREQETDDKLLQQSLRDERKTCVACELLIQYVNPSCSVVKWSCPKVGLGILGADYSRQSHQARVLGAGTSCPKITSKTSSHQHDSWVHGILMVPSMLTKHLNVLKATCCFFQMPVRWIDYIRLSCCVRIF